MNWSSYNNRELTVVLWSDGSHNVFYSGDEYMSDFISHKRDNNNLTYTLETCLQSDFDVKYNGFSVRNYEK